MQGSLQAGTTGCTPDSAANVKPEHATGPGTGTPSSGYAPRSLAPIPVRYASVDPATQRPTALQGDTPRDREETPHQRENSQLAGRFRRWWQVLGSNQRRLSRRFYSPILLPKACAADQRGRRPRPFCWPSPSAMRPCAGSRWRGDARTGTDGGVRRLRLHPPIGAFVAFDLPCSRCLLVVAVFLVPRLGLVHLADPGCRRCDLCQDPAYRQTRRTGRIASRSTHFANRRRRPRRRPVRASYGGGQP
jgi:hypothetical protein